MAFIQRPDGLIDVDTDLGPLPMAPDVARQLGWGGPEQVAAPTPFSQMPGATAELSAGDKEVLGLPPTQTDTPPAWFERPDTTGSGDVVPPQEDPATLVAMQAAQGQPATAGGPSAPAEPEPSMYDRVLAIGPAGTSSSASTRSAKAPIQGPEREKIDKAMAAELEAAQKVAQAQGTQADALTAQAQLEASQAQEALAKDQARRQQMNDKLAALQRRREERRAAIPDTIDPNGWDESGGIASVMAAISIAMGGASQAMGGGENQGKALIDGIVQRHVQQKREEADLAREGFADADSEYQQLLAEYGDPVLAEKQLELNAYEALKKEGQARLQAAQGEETKAAAVQFIAAMEGEQARVRNEMDGRGGEVVTQSQSTVDQAAFRKDLMNAAAMDAQKDNPLSGLSEREQREVRSLQVIMPDGSIKHAGNDVSKKKADEVNAAYVRANQLLNDLEAIARTPGKSLSVEQRTRAEQMEGELTKVVGSLLAPGEALSDGERKYYNSIAVNSAAGFDTFSTVEPMIKQAREMFKRRHEIMTSGQLYDDWQKTKPAKANSNRKDMGY